MSEFNNLIKLWLVAQKFDVESNEYGKVSWAIDELFSLAYSDPKQLLNIVIEILQVDSSPKTIGALGAGPLEELLVNHADDYIDYIIDLAKGNKKFKESCSFIYLDKNDVSETSYDRFQKFKASL